MSKKQCEEPESKRVGTGAEEESGISEEVSGTRSDRGFERADALKWITSEGAQEESARVPVCAEA